MKLLRDNGDLDKANKELKANETRLRTELDEASRALVQLSENEREWSAREGELLSRLDEVRGFATANALLDALLSIRVGFILLLRCLSALGRNATVYPIQKREIGFAAEPTLRPPQAQQKLQVAEADGRDMKVTIAGYLKQFEAMEVTFERNYRMWEAEKAALQEQLQAATLRAKARGARDSRAQRLAQGRAGHGMDDEYESDGGESDASGGSGFRRTRRRAVMRVVVDWASRRRHG